MNAALIIFVFSAWLLAYTYVGYPLIIAVMARRRQPGLLKARISPSVSILVIARNEARQICARIDNLLELDYERSKLEIVVASDGSRDETVVLAKGYRQAGVKVVAFETNRGKPAVLNELVPRLQGSIVVLMDCRQKIAREALQALVDNFADAQVGAVSGQLVLSRDEQTGEGIEGVGFYWRYEKAIRAAESRFDSTVGATGALYAIRRDLFEAIPADTLLDDVLIPMQIVRRGYKVVFEPAAQARENLMANADMEYRRKIRTIAGNFQLFCRHRWLLNPRVNRLWLQTVSHKFMRLLCPLCLLLALISNALLLNSLFFVAVIVLQLLFYAAAVVATALPTTANRMPLLSVPHAFCLLNWSTAVAAYRFFRGRQGVTWEQVKK